MSWGIELWDQYENILAHTSKGIDFCERFTHFLKERSKIELEYAANLKKLVKNFQPKKKDDESPFSWVRGFNCVLKEFFDLASQHEVIAENTQSLVIKDLHNLIQEFRTEKKKYSQEGQKVQEQYKNSLQQLEKVKKQYDRTFKDQEKAYDAYKKADADINLSRAEVERHRNVSNLKSQQCEDSKNEYASQLQQTNHFQSDFFRNSMPQVFQKFQDMEEKRICKCQEYYKMTAKIHRDVIPIINTCLDGIESASDAIDPKADSKMVIDKYKSGFPIPEDIPFEDLSSSSLNGSSSDPNSKSNTPSSYKETIKANTLSGRGKRRGFIGNLFSSSKTDEQREDFSDLPPQQRKKKLQQKIDSIKKDAAKETAEREGMLKLRDVYVKNPALGDPASLDKKIEENAQKLDGLRQQLKKFESYLAEAEGKITIQRPSSNASLHSNSDNISVNSGNTQSPPEPVQAGGEYEPINPDIDHDDCEPEFEEYTVIGTCRALYPFDAMNDGSVPMDQDEEMFILEQDQGDGWTRARKADGSEGFVPTSYIQCHYYDQDQV